MEKLEERECKQCGKKIIGRKDKRFCDYNCRNDYHNELKKNSEVYMNKVNLILRHNRNLLLRFCPEGRALVFEAELLRLGFVPGFFTGLYTSKSGGNEYKLCFEFGFRNNPKYSGQLILVKFDFKDPGFVKHHKDYQY
ncbi:MAG: hypothetical protein RH860_11150 [Cytophagales bacterium]